MNRIRKYNNQYQVLITPYHRFNADFQVLLGNWKDENFRGFNVITYDNLQDALNKSYEMSNIDWDQMILWHKDNYAKLCHIIRDEMRRYHKKGTLIPHIFNSHLIKELMFDRVLKYKNHFTLAHYMNDIISFELIYEHSQDVYNMTSILSQNQALKISYVNVINGTIKMVGDTDVNTHYEILISTKLLSDWRKLSNGKSRIDKMNMLNATIKKQKEIDEQSIEKPLDNH
jgi:hypothetical protein